ncbi:helix-turn-helix domain-containing protein [Salinimicrobium sp. WS361]|uniref:helix-turn-helix domain-containing protein n=1 Tax=Salinimicrobium sp. WS361 TaxID=3425123 RepID=UPI003D6E8F9B
MEKLPLNRKNELLETIKAQVRESGVTNYKLHKLSGLSQSSISRYFNEESDMSLEAFIKICNALELKCYLVPEENITNEFESVLNQ